MVKSASSLTKTFLAAIIFVLALIDGTEIVSLPSKITLTASVVSGVAKVALKLLKISLTSF